jgi:hypothetical protein
VQPEREPEREPPRRETVVRRAAPDGADQADLPVPDTERDTGEPSAGGPGGPGGSGPPPGGRLYDVRLITEASRTAELSAARARARRVQVGLSLCGLVALAIAAAGIGIAAGSAAFWGAAGAVFVGASSVPIAFAARELGVFSESAALVATLLGRAGPSADTSSRDDSSESTEPLLPRSELARELFELGEHLRRKPTTFELFGLHPESRDTEKEAYLDAAHLSYKRAADAGDARAAYWAGRMKLELGLPNEAEELFLSAQNPLGSYWLGGLHARELGGEKVDAWYLARARAGNLVAAYMLGRRHQLSGSFDPDASEELLKPIEI